MVEENDLITLNNNKEYIVLKIITINEEKYAYIIAKDGFSSFAICKINNENVEIIKDEKLLDTLIKKFGSEIYNE